MEQEIREQICQMCAILKPDGDCPIQDGAVQCSFREIHTQSILSLFQPKEGELVENLCQYCVEWSEIEQVCLEPSILDTASCAQLPRLEKLCEAQYQQYRLTMVKLPSEERLAYMLRVRDIRGQLPKTFEQEAQELLLLFQEEKPC